MNFQDFVSEGERDQREAQRQAQAIKELPPLRNTHELAMVIVVGTMVCAEVAACLPDVLHKTAIDAMVDQTERHINRYIDQHKTGGQ
jgi:hypothetical protein